MVFVLELFKSALNDMTSPMTSYPGKSNSMTPRRLGHSSSGKYPYILKKSLHFFRFYNIIQNKFVTGKQPLKLAHSLLGLLSAPYTEADADLLQIYFREVVKWLLKVYISLNIINSLKKREISHFSMQSDFSFTLTGNLFPELPLKVSTALLLSKNPQI